jgi:hypothetical protein
VSTTSEPSVGPRSAVPPVAAVAWLAFAALALGQILVDIDDVVLNVVLPSMVVDVDTTPAQKPWAINAYVLCFGGLLLEVASPIVGGPDRAANRCGRVRYSSLLGTLAESSTTVITARAGQGLAGGAACLGGGEPAGAHLPRPGPAPPCLGAVGAGDRAPAWWSGWSSAVTEHLGCGGSSAATLWWESSLESGCLGCCPSAPHRKSRIDALLAVLAVTALG